jgi:membrane protease YdiL (CAAX protease family)
MRHLLLPVKRPFNMRAYLILVGLLIPAVFAIQPFSLTITGTPNPGFWMLLIDAMIFLLLYVVLGAVGLWLASRIGLGLPFIEGWTKRESNWNRLLGISGISVLTGILLPLFLVLEGALASLVRPIAEVQAGGAPTNVIVPPAWQGLLAAFSAGATEETIFRLFGLTLLAWLGSLPFRGRSARPAPWLLWAANLLFAVLFGLAHLPLTSQIGISLDAMVVIRTIIRNGVAGVAFGWLYWSFGLESAMLAHFSADVIRHCFVPLMTQQADTPHSIIAGAIVVLLIVLAAFWSIRAILQDSKQFPPSSDSDYLQNMEAGFSRPTV